ncbi:MAG: Rha family transcriptional regulator [Pseudomonadota bacterium]|nr:Rha family transcriptional regulator [Pseudomonadota bacterium]
MSLCELTTTPVVTIKNNEVFANSRDVAAYFGKRHGNVLRDIDDLLTGMNDSSDLSSRWFRAADYQTSTGNSAVRTYAAYDMTKDGFTLLVMSYTGKKALQFKLRYIDEFNRMEAQLKAQAPALPDFSNPAEAARAWAAEYEQKLLITKERDEAVKERDVAHQTIGKHTHTIARFTLGNATRMCCGTFGTHCVQIWVKPFTVWGVASIFTA